MHVIRVRADVTTQKRIVSSCEGAFYDVLLPTSILNHRLPTFTSHNVVNSSEVIGFTHLRTLEIAQYVGHHTFLRQMWGVHFVNAIKALTECTVHM